VAIDQSWWLGFVVIILRAIFLLLQMLLFLSFFTHPFLPPTSARIPLPLHPQLQPIHISISIPFAQSADAKIAALL
jgi:hypothetical protein